MKQFAYVDDGAKVHVVNLDEAATANGSTQLIWIHLSLMDPATKTCLTERLGLSELVATALTALETRPRCEPMENGALVNLRGMSLQEEPESDPLVSIRLWIDRGRIVSLSRYTLKAMPPMCAAMQARKVRDPGDFVAMLADEITDQLDPDVAELGDRLDDCELVLDARRAFTLRRRVAVVRAKAISYRRFVAPQRVALERLSHFSAEWLEDDDRQHLSESADRFARMTEELEAVRERAALMAEQITDLRAELIDTRSLWLAVVALIFLPLTFLTGLLGMNVEGIPFAKEPWAFWGVVSLCVVLGAGTLLYFVRSRFLR